MPIKLNRNYNMLIGLKRRWHLGLVGFYGNGNVQLAKLA